MNTVSKRTESQLPKLRVFIASPMDVLDERQAVVQAVLTLNADPEFDHVELVADYYDDQESGLPITADKPAQMTIDDVRRRPNECHIVIGIFGQILGSPPGAEFVQPDGHFYESGTQYELDQAITGASDFGLPRIVIYRRRDNPIELDDLDAKRELQRVSDYFSALKLPSGTPRGIEWYRDFAEFESRIVRELRDLVSDAISAAFEFHCQRKSRLQSIGPATIGRGRQFEELNRVWSRDGVRLFVIKGERGIGKTTLAEQWARARIHLTESNLFRFSFNNPDELGTPDNFFLSAFEFFGIAFPTNGSAMQKAERLFQFLQTKAHFIILDGLESLLDGRDSIMLDDGISHFANLFAGHSDATCVITSTASVAIVGVAYEVELQSLEPIEGARLLRTLGVAGAFEGLVEASNRWQGNPLCLHHLAAELRSFGGRIEQCDKFEPHLNLAASLPATDRFRKLLAYRVDQMEPALVQLMVHLAIVGRPASIVEVYEIIDKSSTNFSNHICNLSLEDEARIVDAALDNSLIAGAANEDATKNFVDRTLKISHPLVHEFFWALGRQRDETNWRNTHLRIAKEKFLISKPCPTSQKMIRDLESVVRHFVFAGQTQYAVSQVYIPYLKGGFSKAHNSRIVGAFDGDLLMLRLFFKEPWAKPDSQISASLVGDLTYEAGFALRANGRLWEGVKAFSVSRDRFVSQGNMLRAAEVSGDIVLTSSLLGRFDKAKLESVTAVKMADESGVFKERVRQRSNKVLAELLVGEFEEAESTISEIENIATQEQSPVPWSFWFSEYTSATKSELPANFQSETVEESMTMMPSLDNALKNLATGKKLFQQLSVRPSNECSGLKELQVCESHLNQAVRFLKNANTDHHRPRGWIARAEFLIWQHRFDEAQRDMRDIQIVSELFGIKLFKLESSYLQLILEIAIHPDQPHIHSIEKTLEQFDNQRYGLRNRQLNLMVVNHRNNF